MGKNGDWALSTLQSQASDPLCLSFPHYTKLLGGNGPQSPLLLPRGQTSCPDRAQGRGSSVPRAWVLRATLPLQPKGERGRYVGLQAAARVRSRTCQGNPCGDRQRDGDAGSDGCSGGNGARPPRGQWGTQRPAATAASTGDR